MALKRTDFCVGMLEAIYSMLALFFAMTTSRQQWKEQQVWRMGVAGDIQFHYLVMGQYKEATLMLGLAWTFSCKMLGIDKFSMFRSGKYDG